MKDKIHDPYEKIKKVLQELNKQNIKYDFGKPFPINPKTKIKF